MTATVSDGGVSISTTTDERGEFTFTGLAGGMWHVSLARDGFIEQTIDVNLDGDTSVACQLRPAAVPQASGRTTRIR